MLVYWITIMKAPISNPLSRANLAARRGVATTAGWIGGLGRNQRRQTKPIFGFLGLEMRVGAQNKPNQSQSGRPTQPRGRSSDLRWQRGGSRGGGVIIVCKTNPILGVIGLETPVWCRGEANRSQFQGPDHGWRRAASNPAGLGMGLGLYSAAESGMLSAAWGRWEPLPRHSKPRRRHRLWGKL